MFSHVGNPDQRLFASYHSSPLRLQFMYDIMMILLLRESVNI